MDMGLPLFLQLVLSPPKGEPSDLARGHGAVALRFSFGCGGGVCLGVDGG